MSESGKATAQKLSATTGHATSFAGLFGYSSEEGLTSQNENNPGPPDDSRGGILVAPEGSWAIRLHTFNPALAKIMLRVLHDLSPLASPTDATLSLHIRSYDEAAASDPQIEQEIRSGLLELDSLARRMLDKGYNEITERSLRRPLLLQMAHHPLFERLGISHSVFKPEPANAG